MLGRRTPTHSPVSLADRSNEIYSIFCFTKNEKLVETFEYLTEFHEIVTPFTPQQTTTPCNFRTNNHASLVLIRSSELVVKVTFLKVNTEILGNSKLGKISHSIFRKVTRLFGIRVKFSIFIFLLSSY